MTVAQLILNLQKRLEAGNVRPETDVCVRDDCDHPYPVERIELCVAGCPDHPREPCSHGQTYLLVC